MIKNIIVYICLLYTGWITAQTAKKYSNEFLNIGVDAASLAMAGSVAASIDNVNAVYWNPAGLTNLQDKQVALMHASYFANIAQYDYAAFAMPVDEKSAIGFSLIRFGVDDIMNTTELIDQNGNIDYNKISLFSAADYAFMISYARKTPIEGLTYGGNAKIVRRIIGKFANSWGFGFDLSAQYKTKTGWRFGVMARDITTTYNMWSINKTEFEKIKNAVEGMNQDLPETSEITLPKVQIGAAKLINFTNDISLLTAFGFHVDFAQTNAVISTKGMSVSPSLGLEFSYTQMVFIRGGLGNFQNNLQIDNTKKVEFQPNIGIGFQYKGIQIDYALTDIGNQSTAIYSNIFSLKLDLEIFRK